MYILIYQKQIVKTDRYMYIDIIYRWNMLQNPKNVK